MEQVAELKSQLVGLEKQLQECVAQIAELTKQLADVDNQQKELHVRKGNFQPTVTKLQHPVEKQNGDEDLGEHTKLHSQGQATLAHGSGAPSIDSGEVDKAKKKQIEIEQFVIRSYAGEAGFLINPDMSIAKVERESYDMRRGDIIHEVNEEAVVDLAEYQKLTKGKGAFMLTLMRPPARRR